MPGDSTNDVLDALSSELIFSNGYALRSFLIASSHLILLGVGAFFSYQYWLDRNIISLLIILSVNSLSWFSLYYGWCWHQAAKLYQDKGDSSKFQALKSGPMELSIVTLILFIVGLGWVLPLGGVIYALCTASFLAFAGVLVSIGFLIILGPIQYRHAQQLMNIRNQLV